MKKFTLSTLILSLTLASFAQTTIRDFEGEITNEFGFTGASEIEIVANPDTDNNINDSANVLQYTALTAQPAEGEGSFVG